MPPQTIINSGPPNSSFSNNTAPTFGFISGANEPSPAFECKLDGGAFEPCISTKPYSNLAVGQHTFSVRAIDTSGNEDTTPESRTWTIDRTSPDTTISGPSGFISNNKSTFGFGGSVASVDHYEVSVFEVPS